MGEFELIARLAGRLSPAGATVAIGIGDDAAVFADGLVACTDLLVEDVHFRRSTASPADVGWKALAVNLSDLAAMGAVPRGALVALTVGPGWSTDDLAAVYDGLRACADAYRCPIVGGDVSRGPSLALAVTVLGHAAVPLVRSGARPGDILVVSGSLGGSEAGRHELERDAATADPALAARHRRPRPRFDAAALLAGTATAMLDVSDGVASDARRLAESSGVRVVIDLDALPLQPGVAEVARERGVAPGAFAATGGEDYELLATLPPVAVPEGVTVIGRIEAGAGVTFLGAGADGVVAGWDHLA
jgi:thiamine-monophosphate kinase